MYPDLTPKEREDAIVREKESRVFNANREGTKYW